MTAEIADRSTAGTPLWITRAETPHLKSAMWLLQPLSREGKMDELDWFVRRRVSQLFKGEDGPRAVELLSRYKGDSPGGRKRVHQAILKLTDRGDLEDLARHVDRALLDYRDVLYAAEYRDKED